MPRYLTCNWMIRERELGVRKLGGGPHLIVAGRSRLLHIVLVGRGAGRRPLGEHQARLCGAAVAQRPWLEPDHRRAPQVNAGKRASRVPRRARADAAVSNLASGAHGFGRRPWADVAGWRCRAGRGDGGGRVRPPESALNGLHGR